MAGPGVHESRPRSAQQERVVAGWTSPLGSVARGQDSHVPLLSSYNSRVPAEEFTADERARLAPYFTNLDGHVFALTNLPETVKGALFARYSRSAKSLRRLFLDEFADKVGEHRRAGARPAAAARRRARREAVRAGVQRLRRRLGRAARRRAHRLRVRLEHPDESARVGTPDGVPRAVHALRALHRPAARPLALSRARGARAGRAARPLRAHDGRRVRALREMDSGDAGALRARGIRRRRRTPKACTARPSARRRSTRCAACCRPRRSRTSASIGTGQAFESLLLRMRASPLAEVRACARRDARSSCARSSPRS